MEEAYNAGKLRTIGVSNFEKQDVYSPPDKASVKPMLDQILAHVSNTPFKLIEYIKSKGLLVEAFSPVGHGKILDNAQIGATAKNAELAFLSSASDPSALGLLLPKTANPDHIRSNAAFDLEISSADMQELIFHSRYG